MGDRGRWLSLRLSLRLGSWRCLLRFPPRWNKWAVLAVLTFAIPIGYVITAVPTVKVLRHAGVENHPVVRATVDVVYAPLIWLSNHVSGCEAFFEAEDALIDWLLDL